MTFGYCYDPVGTECLGRQPGVEALMAFSLRRYPRLRNGGTFVCRPNTGGPGLSTHAEGRGGDSMIPDKATGDRWAIDLVTHAQELGVQRVIWWKREWDSVERSWETYWTPGSKKHPHTDHVHWELCWKAARTLSRAMIEAAFAVDEEADVGKVRILKGATDKLFVVNEEMTLKRPIATPQELADLQTLWRESGTIVLDRSQSPVAQSVLDGIPNA